MTPDEIAGAEAACDRLGNNWYDEYGCTAEGLNPAVVMDLDRVRQVFRALLAAPVTPPTPEQRVAETRNRATEMLGNLNVMLAYPDRYPRGDVFELVVAALAAASARGREEAAKLVEGYTTDQPGVGITYHGAALARAIREGT